MTYYPPPSSMPPAPPYQPPQGPLGFNPYGQPVNPLGPARHAGIMMWVMTALLLMCGVGLIVIFATVDMGPMIERSEQFYGPEMAAQFKASGLNAEQMKLSGFFWGGVGLVVAILMGIFAAFVIRGSMWAIVASIVLTSLLTVMNLCVGGFSALLAARAGPQGLLGGCMMLVPLVVCCVLLYLLFRAARAVSGWRQMQLQMQAQYWQTVQQAGGAPRGYGYGPVPPTSKPPPQQSLGPIPPPPGDQPPPPQV